jgi:chromosome segregation ATPase
MKMHIEFLESAYEKHEALKKETANFTEKIEELNAKMSNLDIELDNVKMENKNLKEVIKMNEVYFKTKEASLKTKISDLQKRTFHHDERFNYSQEKIKTTMSFKDDPFEKVKIVKFRKLKFIDV